MKKKKIVAETIPIKVSSKGDVEIGESRLGFYPVEEHYKTTNKGGAKK